MLSEAETVLPPRQLSLFGPQLLKDRLPYRPYCTDDLGSGLIVRGLQTALSKRYIQPNPPNLRFWMVYDIDRPGGAFAWEEAGLAPPNWAAVNPENGHAHLAWGILVPVYTADPDHIKPLLLAAAIEAAYRDKLRADLAYAGLITKNPTHPHWRTLWFTQYLYELAELSEWVYLPQRVRKNACQTYGLGRNITLFNRLRHWAYGAVLEFRVNGASLETWKDAVMVKAMGYNDFPAPLPLEEVRHTATSVSKWVWSRYTGRLTDEEFSLRQSVRGKLGGRPVTTKETRPWEAAGVSRATWYRQRETEAISPCTEITPIQLGIEL